MEICTGCGAPSTDNQHPYAGVGLDEETGHKAEFPVCLECWRDPAHRTHTLKMHFFDRAMAPQAVIDSENNILATPK